MMELSSTSKDSALIACIMKLSEKTEGELEEGGRRVRGSGGEGGERKKRECTGNVKRGYIVE